ncbi:MAG: nitrous oxide reductase accessory protein NosL [Thermodesulfovibrionales bacterium]
MKRTLKIFVIIWGALALIVPGSLSMADTSGCRTCEAVTPGSPQEVLIDYRDGTARSACGLHCAGAMLAAYRKEDVKLIRVREHGSGKLLDAQKAFWVLGLRDGSRKAFSGRADAESFSAAHGGRVANYRDMMSALFAGMYDEIQTVQSLTGQKVPDDITTHPHCAYCGMDRRQYAHSRVLLRYRDGSEVGLCSVHCAGIDLALHPEKGPVQILAGTFDRRELIDALKAVWVLGGSKQGVMSIRGKWAFGRKEDAEAFMRAFGGSSARFRDVMTAAFEDMWEIIR